MTRYSETISDELKDSVLRIQARHVSDFKSCAFEIMEGMGDEFTVCRWIRARKNKENNTWNLVEYKTAPYLVDGTDIKASDIENMPAEQTVLMHRACFMDALYACSAFESLERDKGKLPVGATHEELGSKYYKTAAESEGIPFDLNSGLPVPMIDGQILATAGQKYTLPPLSEEFEEKSVGNLIDAKQRQAFNVQDVIGQKIDVPEKFNKGTAAAKELITTSTTILRKVENSDEKKKGHAKSLSVAFENASRKGFRDMHVGGICGITLASIFCPIAAGSLWLGSLSSSPFVSIPLGIIGLATGFIGVGGGATAYFLVLHDDKEKPLEFPMRRFNKNLAKIRKDIESLESEEDKNNALQIVDKMELYAYALRASATIAHNEDTDVGSFYTKRMKRDLDILETKAKELGMPEADINALLFSLKKRGDSYDPQEAITAQFKKDMKSIEKAFKNEKEQQLKRLPSPTNG